MDVFEFLSQKTCDIAGHNWRHDFQAEGRIIQDPERASSEVGQGILSNKMGIFRCVRCGIIEYRERVNGE